jgi:hypothetical protein
MNENWKPSEGFVRTHSNIELSDKSGAPNRLCDAEIQDIIEKEFGCSISGFFEKFVGLITDLQISGLRNLTRAIEERHDKNERED